MQACRTPVGLPFTCSILPVGQVWGDDDPAPLSHADPLQALVHAGDDVALPNVGVVGVIAGVAAAREAPGIVVQESPARQFPPPTPAPQPAPLLPASAVLPLEPNLAPRDAANGYCGFLAYFMSIIALSSTSPPGC